MRIIGGTARGRRLCAPEGVQTRPTADKVREALFSILVNDVPGARVLDLFGGSGALALEAMSRGAREAVICDVSAAAMACIGKNVQAVMGNRPGVRVMRCDCMKALDALKLERFDLIFMDPPYRLLDVYARCGAFIVSNGMLSDEGLIVAERSAEARIEWCEGLERIDERVYRDTALEFLREEVGS